jgi:hypothetical protein
MQRCEQNLGSGVPVSTVFDLGKIMFTYLIS